MTRNRSEAMIATTRVLLMLAGLSGTKMIAQTKIEGVISGRSGSRIFLQTGDSAKAVVLLTDGTDVGQVQGLLKARKKEMSMAALIPGLPIKVEGVYEAENQLVAKTIRFKGNDLEQARGCRPARRKPRRQPSRICRS